MRNQIINLGLTVALLTTNPLFAMDVIKDEDSKASIKLHTCPTCLKTPFISLTEGEPTAENVKTPLFTLTELEETDGKGSMHPVPNDVMSTIIIQSGKGAVAPLMYVSRHMYNLCHEPSVWRGFAQKEKFLKFEPKLCPKYQVNHFYDLYNFFTTSQDKLYPQEYKMSVAQLIHLKQNPCGIETEEMKEFKKRIAGDSQCNFITEVPISRQEPKNTWIFEIGGKNLILKNQNDADYDYLNNLSPDDHVIFVVSTIFTTKTTLTLKTGYKNIIKNPEDCIIKNQKGESLNILTFGSEEYTSFCKHEFVREGVHAEDYEKVHLNRFDIELLEDEEKK